MISSMKLYHITLSIQSVLVDIKNALLALEDNLNSDIQALDAVNKKKCTKELKIRNTKLETKKAQKRGEYTVLLKRKVI